MLSYDDSAQLMRDTTFQGRIQVACLNFAGYISGEDPGTTAHNTRYRWAQSAFMAPAMVAANIQPVVVMDPNVQDQGAAIDDATLQTAVETALNKVM